MFLGKSDIPFLVIRLKVSNNPSSPQIQSGQQCSITLSFYEIADIMFQKFLIQIAQNTKAQKLLIIVWFMLTNFVINQINCQIHQPVFSCSWTTERNNHFFSHVVVCKDTFLLFGLIFILKPVCFCLGECATSLCEVFLRISFCNLKKF